LRERRLGCPRIARVTSSKELVSCLKIYLRGTTFGIRGIHSLTLIFSWYITYYHPYLLTRDWLKRVTWLNILQTGEYRLLEIYSVRKQISEHIFASNGGYCLFISRDMSADTFVCDTYLCCHVGRSHDLLFPLLHQMDIDPRVRFLQN